MRTQRDILAFLFGIRALPTDTLKLVPFPKYKK